MYEVVLSKSPSCSCPDAAKGNVCKHWLFVTQRVLHAAPDNPAIWQRGLLASEVEALLSNQDQLRTDASILPDARLRVRSASIAAASACADLFAKADA